MNKIRSSSAGHPDLEDPTPLAPAEFDSVPLEDLLHRAIDAARADPEWESLERTDLFFALCRRKDQATFQLAADLTHSADPLERELGADVLGKLGDDPDEDDELPEYVEQIPPLLWPLVDDAVTSVVESALHALGHFEFEDHELAQLRRFLQSPHLELRRALAKSVASTEADAGIALLAELSCDEDTETRDWATFGLAQLTERDTPALREALLQRLQDPDDEVRAEAFIGLALRDDERVIEPLERALRAESVGELELEAARQIASPSFLPALLELREWWDAEQSELEAAIKACRANTGPSS